MAEGLHLSSRHCEEIETLLHKHLPDVEVWAYGSRVNGQSHDGSDLDLVLRGPELAEIGTSQLGDFIEALQNSTIPFLVEARDWARLPESFHREIEREHVVMVERENCSSLAREWSTATIEDISEKVAMGPFGSSIKVSTFVPDGVPIISGQHLHGVRVDDSPGFNFISHEHAQRLANANVKRGDIVFTHAGNIGQAAYIPNSSMFDRYVISQRQFYMRCDRSKAIPEFIALFFKSPEGRHKLLANASQVGVPSIARPVTYLRTLEISIPPLPEQRAIAHILGTLDDKIELNRRMNETLEAMARALFKSWFVDFDPVRAKMAGRDPGLPQHLADLFPDRLVGSELGEIPEGWTIFHLDELVDHHTKAIAPFSVPEAVFEHFSIPAYDSGQTPTIDWGVTIKSNKIIIPSDAVLLSKLNPEIRRVWMPDTPNERLQICSTEFLVFTPRLPANRSLLFSLFTEPAFRTMLQSMVTGTSKSHQRVAPKALKQAEVLSGTPALFDRFGDLAAPMLARMVRSRTESHALAALRDALLPKLVSGELRVNDADKQAEAVI